MKMPVFFGLVTLLSGLVSGVAQILPSGAHAVSPLGSAALIIPAAIPATVDTSVTVPIAFQGGGNAIGSITFSIDFDQTCLTFDARDVNNDGQPDAVQFKTPLAFRSSISYDAADVNGELDVVIADYSLPIASLPDADPLLTVKFTPHCTPVGNTVILAPVRFSSKTQASFGSVDGLDVAGTTHDGSVAIHAQSGHTPTPTTTPTLDPGTPSASPTEPATLTPTATPTPDPGTPSVTPTDAPTATATPTLVESVTPTATVLSTPTRVPNTPSATPGVSTPTPALRLYLPLLEQDGP